MSGFFLRTRCRGRYSSFSQGLMGGWKTPCGRQVSSTICGYFLYTCTCHLQDMKVATSSAGFKTSVTVFAGHAHADLDTADNKEAITFRQADNTAAEGLLR